jgi:hypothetical protein
MSTLKRGLCSGIGAAGLLAGVFVMNVPLGAGGQTPPATVTFAKDIAPILQRSCQKCHRPDGVAPMSLVTYEDVRPWARALKQRTGIGPRAGVMPPWYIEKDIGIQEFQDDPSLSEDEIAKIAKWADSGAPLGNPADMPKPIVFSDASVWHIGTPDLIVKGPEVLVKGNAPDWWGTLDSVPTGLTEDRYISAVEVKEINDVPSRSSGRATVGGRFVFHHQNYAAQVPGIDDGREIFAGTGPNSTSLPTHEVGRDGDIFDPKAGRLLAAGSHLIFRSAHLHANGRDTKAHLEYAFKFHPKGYKPTVRVAQLGLGSGSQIDIRPMESNQQLHAYTVLQEHTKITTFEPHLHAPGTRMCLEAIWGTIIETLSCAGYDHNWVRSYIYADGAAPLLPKGTILHIIGYMDLTPANRNIVDPRNWQGGGQRSVANMFLLLSHGVTLNEEEFQKEMVARREKLRLSGKDVMIGCPLCNVVTRMTTTTASR